MPGIGVFSSNLRGAVGFPLEPLTSSPKISSTAISSLKAVANPTSKGVDVSFAVTDITGISTVTLSRNYVNDPGTATVLQTWGAAQLKYAWSDTDNGLQQQSNAHYWLTLHPVGISGAIKVEGPVSIGLNPQLSSPFPASSISAGHGAALNGVVTVTVNVTGIAPAYQIFVTGYQGNTSPVAVATAITTPVQFTLDATGEAVTLTALAASAGGALAATGPTTTLVLNGAATIPATPQGVLVTQISTGNQITFPASADAGPTYLIYVAQYPQPFLLATLLATVTATSGTVEYLDTAGLTSQWEYFIVAVGAAGNSLPSAAAYPDVLYTSAAIPSNVPANTSNTATVDSVDSGSSALVRIYGPGGVGTSYSRITGYGSLTRPNGTISGLAYITKYIILWTGSAFIAVTSYPPTLPDNYEYVGGLTTTAASGISGSGATATAVINTAGNVTQVNPVTYGSGYASATVSISGGGGSGSQATANVVGGQVTSYTVTNGGTGYTSAPSITVVPGPGTGTTGGGGSTGSTGGTRYGGFVLD